MKNFCKNFTRSMHGPVIFLRHISATVITALVDYLTFIILFYFILKFFIPDNNYRTYLSIYGGRGFSLLINFILIKKFAFKSQNDIKMSVPLYIIQVIVVAYILAFMINIASSYTDTNRALLMLIFQALLYPVNFIIQKKIIFREKESKTV